jgi:hypothetical protein
LRETVLAASDPRPLEHDDPTGLGVLFFAEFARQIHAKEIATRSLILINSTRPIACMMALANLVEKLHETGFDISNRRL